ncbi:integrase [Caballeronia novacaledonica]|uniref:Integrase n=1 Tax=Caballeronia novacaledonica TaxID=1544861 RepID=A0A2U3I8U9_9BURK|nr:integrase [Caballeronia novacaledonica]
MVFLAPLDGYHADRYQLRNLKPQDKLYKVNDRDGLYVAITPAGSISFRYNYSINGRQATLTFGRYGVGGITLSEARERLNEAKKLVAAGNSPAKEKARDKARVKDAETFGAWADKWLRGHQMTDSTRDMRRSIYERDLKARFGNLKLNEITHEDLRTLTDAIVARGAPATAVHVREVVLQVYRWAIERGQKVENPADMVRPTTIARFEPRDRALTPDEIGLMYHIERIAPRRLYVPRRACCC